MHKRRGKKWSKEETVRSEVELISFVCQEMQDMTNCYDSLLSAAAATANTAYGMRITCVLISISM